MRANFERYVDQITQNVIPLLNIWKILTRIKVIVQWKSKNRVALSNHVRYRAWYSGYVRCVWTFTVTSFSWTSHNYSQVVPLFTSNVNNTNMWNGIILIRMDIEKNKNNICQILYIMMNIHKTWFILRKLRKSALYSTARKLRKYVYVNSFIFKN